MDDAELSGPEAGVVATARAMAKVEGAAAILLVEGLSDQIALEALARRRGRDLDAERVVVLPAGGAHAVPRFLARFGPQGVRLAGLCDAGEEHVFRRGLARAGIGTPATRAEMATLGFHVCVADLEDELIRAIGVPAIEGLLDEHGDLGPFRTMQHQPVWRDRPPEAQLRRFFASGSRRKLRYAGLLVETVDLDRVPHPLDAVLTNTRP
ncbi:TOPRIM nucleotidyl transferase/hydrolase domain-containing protein [Dactylosporangium sp. CA-152071]|uniref:TOPRIM nucleotidyl transferase/hydrolase domain-containing protein n=1 Tax=Dactylosporangium sp. CA-152071 TaxID=3239933 RepID=UPI003D9062E9